MRNIVITSGELRKYRDNNQCSMQEAKNMVIKERLLEFINHPEFDLAAVKTVLTVLVRNTYFKGL